MVFEKFVVYFLDKYLSDYIENLDYKKLNIDMWSGNVMLENLSLKANALAGFNLPVIVKLGYLQKLTLQIPWKNLYTQPTRVTIDGLYLIVVPKIEVEYDAEQDENDQHKAKMKEVNKIEKLRKDKEDLENTNKIEDDNDTFSARMKLQIIQNLELSIHNIHIVYEDKTTKPHHPFAFGITLNSIIFQTTNKEWIPTILKENTPVIYKLGELNALSIYWNTDIQSNANEIMKTLQAKIALDNKQTPKDMEYIFRPFNVKAKLIMTLKPRQQNFEKSMFLITIDLEQISLNLTRAQYLDILDLLEYQDHITTKLKYIKYRPKKFDNAKQKWKFAYNVIVNEKIKPHLECYKWKNIQIHSNHCKEYRYIYFQELIGKITDVQKQRAEELEKKLDVFNLTYIHRRAQIEAKKKKQQEPPKTFFSTISNWWNKKSDQVDPELDLEKVLSDEEKKKFYQTIGYEGEDTSTLTYPKEYVDIDLTIRLIMLDLNIWSEINENDQQVISRACLPDTELIFRRRPATSSVLFLVSLGSFQVFGLTTDLIQSESSNEGRPILVQPASSNNPKLLQAEFEINPLNKDSGYRVQVISQSLEIKYNAPTINKLIECFEKGTRHNLQGIKQAAYMTYSDVKYESILLMKSNIEKVKVLDVYIDLQSSYFLLPENGVYYDGCPVICMDTGHLVLQQGTIANIDKEAIMNNYSQFRLELTNFQLLYANKHENWKSAREEENTRLHLIKPITLYTNIFKCIYSDNLNFPAWKISGQIPAVNMRISDTRLFKIMNHIQSLPFPQSKPSSIIVTEKTSTLIDTTQQTFKIIETITKDQEIEKISEKQLTQIEANFEISKIDLLLEEEKDNQEHPFLRISFLSICVQTLIKTSDIEFQASLDDLIIFHEQFITKANHHLRFLAAQQDENKIKTKKLVTIHVLHSSSKDDGLKNKVRIHLSKLVLTLQLEALLSIMRFQDNIMQKWPTAISEEQTKNNQVLEKIPEENKTMTTGSKFTTLEIEADLEEVRVVIATIHTQMFDIYLQGVKADMHHALNETLVDLILTDLCIFDPNNDARHPKIISQQNGDNELLSISMVLFNYPKRHTKALNDVDCSVKLNFAKANIIFLYKHINQLMGFIDTLNISKAALEFASHRADAVYEQVQKLQNQAFKLRLNATFNGPNIIVPINSSSDEALFLDLGKLILQTSFIDDPKRLLVEQQEVIIENVLASRVRLNENNEIQSEINLLECAELKIHINRLLYQEMVKTTANISIKMQWDLIHFRLAKDDYLCAMKLLTENFKEQTMANVIDEQYRYRQEQQKREEDALRNAVIKKQTERQIGEILKKLKIHAEIKKLALTLYLGESNLINRRVQHNENMKVAYVEIETFEFILRQFSDSSYKIVTRIKNFLCDDLREAHREDAVIHIMDRHFTVDPNAYMLIASLDFKPTDQTLLVAQRLFNIQLESLYICIKLDYLMILQDFFMSDLPINDANSPENQSSDDSMESFTPSSNVETRVDILVKNPEIILLEDQQNSNSNCLVLNLTLHLLIINMENDTKIFGNVNDLTIFSSNFAELKHSKIKYRILQPAKVDLTVFMYPKQQQIDVRISNIIVNIAPAALRILIGVTNSLGKNQSTIEHEKFDTSTMFDHKSLTKANFWFLKAEEDNESSSMGKSLREKEKKKKIKTNLSQQLFLTLTTIEIKLDIGFDLITKSVVAMCLSNWTVDLKNWSDEMSVFSTVDIEAALYNEHTLAWEPFIEPRLDRNDARLSPWNVICSITPILPVSDHRESATTNKKVSGLNAKQLISVRSEQLLNITITKTGLDLIKRLSSLFNDIYNQRLPKITDHDKPMLSLLNSTGKNIFINNLNGLEFTNNILRTSAFLEQNESLALTALSERSSSAYRLSVIEEQTFRNRQEFSIQINETRKLISINRTWQRIYNLQSSSDPSYPIQILCDTQIHHNQRRVILGSIVKIFNNTILPIIILDLDSITGKTYHRIESNENFYMPIDLLYKNSNSSIFIGVDENDQNGSAIDFFIFDWKTKTTNEQTLRLKNGKTVHLIIYKETKEAYSENTDQLDRISYCIYIHSAFHLTNLLPIDIQCSINNVEKVYLVPNQLQMITSSNKNSVLKFIIPFYDMFKWISDPVDLRIRKTSDSNEQIVTFHNDTTPSTQRILRMVLEIDIFHESYRLSLYTPFWIVNHTDLKLDFRIGNERAVIRNTDQSFLICPEKYKSDASEKGEIRLHSAAKDNTAMHWSETFSLDVIKSIGMASCKGQNDKTYMICVDITTSSFGLTKIVTLSPAMVIINQTSIPIEIVETITGTEQSKWIMIERDEIIPFWPQNAKEGLMYVGYAHNRTTSKPFSMNKKHQTLLYMNDKERLIIFVEVIATDFDGIRVIFSDYKQGDAPVLLVNHTQNQLISFVQKDEKEIQYLVPEHFVYYTWVNPLKPREMTIKCDGRTKMIELSPHCGVLDTNENHSAVRYVVFIDGAQTVLLFSDNQQIIDMALNVPSSTGSICRRLQIGFSNVGLSIVNDIAREELLYISLNKSKVIWVQMKKCQVKPLSYDIQTQLEELYTTNLQLLDANPDDKTLRQTKYPMNKYREVSFSADTAELIDQKGKHKLAKRQSLDGLWIEYTWSMTGAALYAYINRIQIDNQLDNAGFPSMLYPVLPKRTDSDIVEKPFIELSIYESKTVQSNIMHFQYCKLLIQEFALRIDQGLILAILEFLREEKNAMAPMINMNTDLKYIHDSFRAIIKAQTDARAGETQMYFDNIHLSPLKIHVSFSMYGSKPNEELFAEYPLVGFLLKTLNVAEVQDVILRLGFYQRLSDRFTITKLKNEVSAHYQNQLMKQIHVLILGLDVLGNPLGIIRGLAEGVESLFYEPYKGAIEGPIEFAEGVATGVFTLVGSTVGTTAGAFAKITGVIGQSLATLTFDDEYKASRIHRRDPRSNAGTDIANGVKNVVMGFFNGITGVVIKPISGAIDGGASGFVVGLGKGILGLGAQPIGGVIDFTIQSVTTPEQIVHRIRYPRHISRDGLVRPYVPHEAAGFYILNRLEKGDYAKTDTYVAHITCTDSRLSWLMATSKRILFITDSSLFGIYQTEWIMDYVELKKIPVIIPDKQAIQILVKKPSEYSQSFGKMVKYKTIDDARYLVAKITHAMHSAGL